MLKKGSKNWHPTPAYAPWTEMQKALEKLRHFRPSRVDIALLQTYGIAPKNERAVVNALKYLRLVDAQGVPTDNLSLVQVKGDYYARNLADLVREAYADLFSRIDLTSALPETIHNYFLAQKVGPTVAAKCSRLFLGLCREAALPLSPALAAPSARERRQPNIRRPLPRNHATETGNGRNGAVVAQVRGETSLDLLQAKMKLFEKLPNFDASWKPESIELVFREFHRLFDRLEDTAEVTQVGEESEVVARSGRRPRR